MKLFTYRGIRVRAFYRHIRGITWFYLVVPFFISDWKLLLCQLRRIERPSLAIRLFYWGYSFRFLLSGLPTKSHVLRENRLLPKAQ